MADQLVKRRPSEGYQKVYPKTFLNSVIDKNTGITLQEILQGFNMYFLSFTGEKSSTRNSLPQSLRRKGIWITYILYDNTVVTEWYDSDEINDTAWGSDDNWKAIDNIIKEITISPNGNWVLNGVETEFSARGEPGSKGDPGVSPYFVNVFTTRGNIVIEDFIEETLYAEVWQGDSNITNELEPSKFSWERVSDNPALDEEWNLAHKGVGSSIIINTQNIAKRALFTCIVNLDPQSALSVKGQITITTEWAWAEY